MNINSVFSTLASFRAGILAAAKLIVPLVQIAHGDLLGADRHTKAVEMLRSFFPSLPKWAADAFIGAAYGWVKSHMPDALKPATGFVNEDLKIAAGTSPFAETLRAGTLGQIIAPQPAAPQPVGESSPQSAAILQPRPTLQPQAPSGSEAPPAGAVS